MILYVLLIFILMSSFVYDAIIIMMTVVIIMWVTWPERSKDEVKQAWRAQSRSIQGAVRPGLCSSVDDTISHHSEGHKSLE